MEETNINSLNQTYLSQGESYDDNNKDWSSMKDTTPIEDELTLEYLKKEIDKVKINL